MSCYLLAKKATNEEPTQILWNTILTTWFPPVGPMAYKLAIKSPTLASDGEPDAIVIEVRFIGNGDVRSSTQLLENQIFMVECKSSEYDTTSGWRNAATQLIDYLVDNTNGSTRLFGALAIGTKVEVYEWQYGRNPPLFPIHAGRLDLGKAADRHTFEVAMEQVRTEAWDYLLQR
ncbi:hypothetical protein QQZ08_001872 [Neonectria magnoliae]|uniref:Uncharacterized protein n=1 Tax=Neonectria magnoliae TaxID=2732573 RepID=A0ABR1IDI1_9HYPO